MIRPSLHPAAPEPPPRQAAAAPRADASAVGGGAAAGTGGAEVVIAGGGIVGACCAVALLRAGCRVALVEPGEPGGPQSASFGNGGWISPASVVPMSTPGLWRRVPGLLADRRGPLTLRPRAVPALLPWLWRFLRAGATVPRVEATATVLAAMLADAPARHAALARDAGVPGLIRRHGLLYAYADDEALAADALGWALRDRAGVRHERIALDADTWERWPGTAGQRIGLRVPGGAHCIDPGGWAAALIAQAVGLGLRRVTGRVVGIVRRGHAVSAVRIGPPIGRDASGPPMTESARSDAIACDHVVLAAGIGGAALAAAAGHRVPLAAERGYHLVLPLPDADAARRFAEAPPVMPAAGRMAITVMHDGLRIAGQVELARPGDPPDWRRADVLWSHARTLLGEASWRATGLEGRRDASAAPDGVSRWMGHRPSTPDGLPVIGALPGCPSVVCAFGHGHTGLAMAPLTAEAVMRAVTGRGWDDADSAQALAIAACTPARFRP
jgi:D-amino-acid dehydrogenase